MADDIVTRLQCAYPSGEWPCGSCTFCAARAEIERLRAADQYVEYLGVDWCVLHHGVRNEDWDRCDAFDWADGDDMLDEDGEYLPCDLRPLAYRETRRD